MQRRYTVPTVFVYLGVMLSSILIWFLLFKRPVYEAVLVSFFILLTITGTWESFFPLSIAPFLPISSTQ